MVNIRMESRVENLAKEFAIVKGDVETMKMWMMEMRDSLTHIEGRGKNVEEGS